MGKLLLSPTRTYAPILLNILREERRRHIHGLVHCSGGGQTKVLSCLLSSPPNDKGLHVIKDDLFDVPIVFQMIQEESKTPWGEMYRVFNMGHRMEVYVDGSSGSGSKAVEEIMSIAQSFGVDAKVIGRVEENDDGRGGNHRLTIQGPHGTYTYER